MRINLTNRDVNLKYLSSTSIFTMKIEKLYQHRYMKAIVVILQ